MTGFSLGLSGWQTAFLITGALPLAGMILLLLAIGSLPNVIHPRAPTCACGGNYANNRSARNLLLGYTSHNWELIGMWTWAPALIAASFVISGQETVKATQSSAYFVTALHLVGAFSAYSMGRLSDRIGRRTVLIWAAAIATGFSFGIGWLVVFTPYLIAVLVILYSFFALGDSPVLSTAMAERVEPGALGAMLAARSLAGFISGAVAPLVFGGVVDLLRAGEASESIVWGAAFATLGLGGLLAVWFAVRLPERG